MPTSSSSDVEPEDRVALVATVCGCGVAVAGWRETWTLVGGLALGFGGVLLALRERRGRAASPASRSRSLLGGLLALAVTAHLALFGLRFLEGWTIGQLLSDGAAFDRLGAEGRRLAAWGALCRAIATAASGAFLAGAVWRNRRSAPPPGPEA